MQKLSTLATETPTRQQDDALWEYGDVARRLKVSVSTVRNYKRSRGLPFKRIGGTVRFVPAEIDQWIEAQQEPQQDKAA